MDAPLTFYMDGLYSYAMVLTGDATVAADLVQETYVRATESTGPLREDSNVKASLYTILRNIGLKQVRQRRTRPRLPEMDADENTADLVIETAKDPHGVYVSKVEVKQVREAIMRLPLKLREVILLREYGELSYQEIATLLDCPLGTVMSRHARARSKLRTLLSTAIHRRAQRSAVAVGTRMGREPWRYLGMMF
jgi:RNA polymerase sigma-70 factor (ECF subfamily)